VIFSKSELDTAAVELLGNAFVACSKNVSAQLAPGFLASISGRNAGALSVFKDGEEEVMFEFSLSLSLSLSL
jgi:hypothetical protein